MSVSLLPRFFEDRAGEGPSAVFIGTRFGVVEGETLAGGATPLFFGVAGEDDDFSPSVIVAIELLLVIPPASTLFRLLCEAEPSSDRLAREMSSFDKSAPPSSPVFDLRCHSCTLTNRYRFRARIDADRRPVVAYLPRPDRSGTESDREEDCFLDEPVGRVVVPVFSHSKDTSEKRLRHTVSVQPERWGRCAHMTQRSGCSEPLRMSDSLRSDFFCLTRASIFSPSAGDS